MHSASSPSHPRPSDDPGTVYPTRAARRAAEAAAPPTTVGEPRDRRNADGRDAAPLSRREALRRERDAAAAAASPEAVLPAGAAQAAAPAEIAPAAAPAEAAPAAAPAEAAPVEAAAAETAPVSSIAPEATSAPIAEHRRMDAGPAAPRVPEQSIAAVAPGLAATASTGPAAPLDTPFDDLLFGGADDASRDRSADDDDDGPSAPRGIDVFDSAPAPTDDDDATPGRASGGDAAADGDTGHPAPRDASSIADPSSIADAAHGMPVRIPTGTLLRVATGSIPTQLPGAQRPAARPSAGALQIARPVAAVSIPRRRAAVPAHHGTTTVRRDKHPVRRRTLFASVASLGLAGGLLAGIPADAAPVTLGSHAFASSTAKAGRTQSLDVSASVRMPTAITDDYVAGALAGIIASQGGEEGAAASAAVGQALQVGGDRQTVVRTALGYLGAPYRLGGDTMDGIDCSGLVLRSYESIGVTLGRVVHLQDQAGTRIDESTAQPGDLVVFDDNEHIGIYLGGGLLVAAPAPGRTVEIQTAQSWSSVPHHYTRLLGS